MITLWKTWTVIRASGLSAYVLWTATISLAALAPLLKRPVLQLAHQYTAFAATLFAFIHVAVLWIDHYDPFTPLETLIPFIAHRDVYANGLGTIALYLLVALILSGDMIKIIGKTLWRLIHYSAALGFFLTTLHGIAVGTDTPSLLTFYAVNVIVAIAPLFVVWWHKGGKNHEHSSSGR